jgi:5-methylcytosine-specific restriction endonuclease McrA
MTPIRDKNPRVKLEPDACDRLRLQILERDRWRCQNCGSLQNLQVHHQELRSHSGNDTEENLITLCAPCHRRAHRSLENHQYGGSNPSPFAT